MAAAPTCIEKYGTDKPCPNCKKTGTHFYRDNRSKRSIAELEVKCEHNAKRHCTWVGTVGTLEEHVASCKYTLLPCPKECKDDSDKAKQFTRKDLDKHLKEDCPNRDYKCKYCGEKGTYTSITNIHDQTCPEKPVPCPNGCSATMQRQLVSEHVTTECELTVIACKYKRLGCDRELKRLDMAAHEEDGKLHLRMAMDTTSKLTVELEDKTGELESKTAELEIKTVELENKTDKLENKTDELENKTVELASKSVEFESKIIELASKRIRLECKTEPLKLMVVDYQEKKENKERVQSRSHYTSTNGYRVAIKIYPNGCGRGESTHVSVFAFILKGRNDAKLKWPFIGKIIFKLLNQLEDKNHQQGTMELTAERNAQVGSSWGDPQFIHHSALDHDPVKKTQYLKDDTLYFRMSVEPADNKPWLQ